MRLGKLSDSVTPCLDVLVLLLRSGLSVLTFLALFHARAEVAAATSVGIPGFGADHRNRRWHRGMGTPTSASPQLTDHPSLRHARDRSVRHATEGPVTCTHSCPLSPAPTPPGFHPWRQRQRRRPVGGWHGSSVTHGP